DHRVAFAGDCRYGQLAEAGPGGWRAREREAGVAAAGPFVEQGSERGLPAGAERGDPERPGQVLARGPRQIEERVGGGHPQRLGAGGDLDDFVSRLHLALLEHAEVEAWSVM